MEHAGMDFFNVAELDEASGSGGLVLQRFPAAVREKLGHDWHNKGPKVAQEPSGCELRFVTDARVFSLRLGALDSDSEAIVYQGPFVHSRVHLPAGRISTLQLEGHQRIREADPGVLARAGAFSPSVWRVLLGRGGPVQFFGIDCFGKQHRPPHPDEVPSKTMLCYGSSITHGSSVMVYHNAYVIQAARRLGVNVLNKGLSGSAFAEPPLADYLASLPWDAAWLELGVNMRDLFSVDAFSERLHYLLEGMNRAAAGRPVCMTTIYPNYADFALNGNSEAKQRSEGYNRLIRDAADRYPGLKVFEGSALLPDVGDLAADLLHPSDFGHIIMGENLARLLRPLF